MRDIVLTIIIFATIPFILARPHIGILVWSWLSYMNPHRLTWNFAYSLPFAQIVAIATLISLLFSKEPKKIPITSLTVIWLLFIIWMIVTTLFAFFPDDAYEQLIKVLKIQFVTFLTMMVITNKERINLLILVIALSIGFYSIKGGLFTALTGGGSRVYGPAGSFIAENNALALATLMVIPLFNYLRSIYTQKWANIALIIAMVLSTLSALGSYSRGAFLAGFVVMAFFWFKSKRKLVTALVLVIIVPLAITFMPDKWTERIMTISTRADADIQDLESMRISLPIESRDWIGWWPSDRSALGRVNAWNYSINVANHRFTGAGFESWSPATFQAYAPVVEAVHAAHSIYFAVLADHGWIGFSLFALILLMAWRTANWIIKHSKKDPELAWTGDLARMIQISLIAYGSGGAFLSLAYYDLPWHLIAILVLCKQQIVKHPKFQEHQQSSDAPYAGSTIAAERT